MNHPFRRLLSCAVCMIIFLSLLPASYAEEADTGSTAESISVPDAVTNAVGFTSWDYLYDGVLLSGGTSAATASLTMEYDDGIGSLYFIYRLEYGEYTVTNNDTGEDATVGQDKFLHDFIDLVELFGSAPTSVTVSWNSGAVKLNEMYIFTTGEAPDYVQKWEAPVEDKTDLILFSTHGDDEQLFFAGILPYYANALGYQVQVVYLTDHRNNTDQRVHEMLNGLWAVGCTTYPVFGSFDDFLYDTMEETYDVFESQGVTRDDIIEYCVEQIRRFKPLVIVAHDFAGEYGHGQHMVYADCVAAALEISNDASYYPELAEEYGVWDVPKAYFHLYEENQIVMDWDTPMEELDGMTPFEVTQQLGFPCHESQQWTWFYGWIYGKTTTITKASEIETYNPCLYGLYRTTVGLDVEKNDFFENLTTYEEQEAIALAEAEAAAATAEATEPESTTASTQISTVQDSSSGTSQSTQAQQEAAARRRSIMLKIVGVALALIGIMVLYNLWQEHQRRRRRKRRHRPKMENLEK